MIDQMGKVIDCAVWAKKPDVNPFHEEYQAAGDGQKKAPASVKEGPRPHQEAGPQKNPVPPKQ